MAKKKTKSPSPTTAASGPVQPAPANKKRRKATTKPQERGQRDQGGAASAGPAAAQTPGETNGTAPAALAKRRGRRDAKAQKLSALDAAALVLAEAGQPMSCQEMIAAMAQKGYWSSP